MSHWRSHVDADSPHLRFHDLEGKSPLKVTIESYGDEEVYEPNEKVKGSMLFLKFKGGDKKLGICATNGCIIEKVTGESDVDGWIGKEIVLRTAICKGEPCVRVDVPKGTRMPGRFPKFTYTDGE